MTASDSTNRSLAVLFLFNLCAAAVLFASFSLFSLPQFLPCTYPIASNLAFALAIALIIQFFIFTKHRIRSHFLTAGIDIVLILLTLWLGTYSISPLGFSSNRIPFVQGFILNRSMRADLHVASSDAISLVNGSITGIRPVTLPVSANCIWQSSNGGTFDDPRNCSIAYIPPANSSLDVLNVLIRPSCNLPEAHEELKVVVLP